MQQAFDTNRDCSRFLPFMRDRGFRTAIRYYTAAAGPKRLTRGEAERIVAAGFTIAAVYQDTARMAEDFSEAVGRAAGRRAHDHALSVIGQPSGSAIYFSVDFDASSAELAGHIVPFFRGVQSAMEEASLGGASYDMGVYGSGLTCRTLSEAGLVRFTWLSMSMGFRESRQYRDSRQWALLQSLQVSNVATPAGSFDYDPDEIGPGGCGDFTLDQVGIPIVQPGRFRVISRIGLNLRTGPGTEFPVIRTMPLGTELSVIGRSGNWALADLQQDGIADGHCHSSLLAPA